MPRVERDGTTIIFHPEEGTHSASVVLMHGLGDSADGWEDVASMFSRNMPHIKFILPTAPTVPVTMNGKMKLE